MKDRRYLFFALGCALALVFILNGGRHDNWLTPPSASGAEETPAEAIAAQIRSQGYPCSSPISAQRDSGRSSPDEAVWILTCADARYRVRLIPDMAARVERLG